MGYFPLEGGGAEVFGEVGGFDESRVRGGEGGEGVVVHPVRAGVHAEDGNVLDEGAEDVDFAEGEEVVGCWAAEHVALVCGFAEAMEEVEGFVGCEARLAGRLIARDDGGFGGT